MEKSVRLRHEFVESVPPDREEGVLYISMEFKTAIHSCACGCGHKVVTPFSPAEWSLEFDGDTVSMDPSIGNHSFPCGSHYFITRNEVVWAAKWTGERIRRGRAAEDARRARYEVLRDANATPGATTVTPTGTRRFLSLLKSKFKSS